MSDDPEASAAVLSVLLASASDNDLRAIIRSATKAGLLWTCPDCRALLYLTSDSCSADGARRPTEGTLS